MSGAEVLKIVSVCRWAVFDAMKKAAPNVEIGVRVSATDWIEGGWNLKETIKLVEILKERGCAFVDVSTGGLHSSQKINVSYGYQLPFARAVRLQPGFRQLPAA